MGFFQIPEYLTKEVFVPSFETRLQALETDSDGFVRVFSVSKWQNSVIHLSLNPHQLEGRKDEYYFHKHFCSSVVNESIIQSICKM